MTDNTTNIREVVLDVLLEVLENHNLSHIVLKQALEKYLFLERQDRAFITRCVEGTLEYRIQIDAVLDQQVMSLRDVMNFKVGQTLMLNSAPDSPIELKCGGIPLVKGHIGRVGPFVAVKVDRAFRRTAGTSKI